MWRSGKAYGLQADSFDGAGRQVDPQNGGTGLSRNWRPASRSAAGDFDYAIDRDGDGLQAGRDRGARAVCPRAKNVPAHGWSADFERGGRPATKPAAGNVRFGGRCAFVRRNEERVDGRRSRGLLSSRTG